MTGAGSWLCREKVLDRQADVFGDLTKQCRRNVASLMKRHGRPATVGMGYATSTV